MHARLLISLLLLFAGTVNGESEEFSLNSDELRGSEEWPSLADRDSADNLGIFMSDFFGDSKTQLTLDLDMFRELYTELNRYYKAAESGDTDYIQKVMDFLAPLRKYDISAPCLSDVFTFLMTTYSYAHTSVKSRQCDNCNCSLSYNSEFARYRWIFNVLDSIGKVPSAIFGGNNLWTGSWRVCRKVSVLKNNQNQYWNGQYCMARFQSYNKNNPLKAFMSKPRDPAETCFSNASATNETDWSEDDLKCFDLMPLLNVGICTPDTCTDYDVRQMLKFIYHSAELSFNRPLVCDVSVQCSNNHPEKQLWHHTSSIAFSFFLVVIFTLLVFGTGYDLYVEQPLREHLSKKAHRRQKSLEFEGFSYEQIQQYTLDDYMDRPRSIFVTTLMMFSVSRNLKYIMDTRTEDGQIRCLHGARFLSMAWIIYGHTYYYICTSFTTDNLLQTMQNFPKYFSNQVVVQAPLAVDSFFFLSGLLTAYIFIGKIRKNQVKLKAFATWFAYYVRRYLRLTPVYVFVMVLEITIFSYISEGPFWRPIETNFCKNSWWVNLLYLNNFIKQDDSCMGWSWYLANDFQFYCFAPILIILLYKFRTGGVLFGVLCIVASSIVTVLITIQKGYPPAPLLTTKLQIVTILNEYWVDLYVKPYVRCGPYIIGCLTGYLLLEKDRPIFKFNTVKWIVCWLLSIALGLYSIFGLFHYTKTGDISLWYSLTYTAIGRLSFALFLSWVVFACEIDSNGKINAIIGHRMFVPLGKITFCAYLIHPILLQSYYLSRPSAFHFTHSYQMIYMFIIALFSSYGFALLLSLAFEVPIMHLDKILFGGAESRRRPTNTSSTEPTNAENQNGKKKSTDLAEFQSPANDESVEENGVRQTEQRKPLLEEKEQSTA
ncbi:hypothetical protein M3Y97_00544800 [Aphelenchoides bicaudatus]|nr:hypothetical protein M3Y97_00544800 [Aphelenchoides bicaudatus]